MNDGKWLEGSPKEFPELIVMLYILIEVLFIHETEFIELFN